MEHNTHVSMARVKEILNNYKFINADIELLEMEKGLILSSKGDVSGIDYDAMPKGGGISNPVEKSVLHCSSEVDRIDNEINRMRLQMKVIELTYSRLDANYRNMFDILYSDVSTLTVQAICRKLCIGKDKYYADRNQLLLLFQTMISKYKNYF